MANAYLFVLCPPFSGSTVLWKLLGTSPVVSSHSVEGQVVDGVKEIMRNDPWNPDKPMPWPEIKTKWERAWDMSKPILLEKSPPNIVRAFELEQHFAPAHFIAMVRNPYALCEGLQRRREMAVEMAASRWVVHATHQFNNITKLKRIVHFTYEELSDTPALIKEKILAFMPQLHDLDLTQSFEVHSVQGHGARQLYNFNHEKIARLSAAEIHRINAVLQAHERLMKFFGYQYI
ncbi:hypothetical protein HUU05_02340 [candidate division KSB1 bacterium]|nr:hypothetical protein [candidate division KSB1 bacterium]